MPNDFLLATRTDFTLVADKIRLEKGVQGTMSFPNGFIANIPSMPTLHAVQIAQVANSLSITNPATNGDFATSFDIYDGNTVVGSTSSATVNLYGLGLATGSHSLTVKAKGTNFHDSAASSAISYTLYSITANITAGTSSGNTVIGSNGTALVTITPNSGYVRPSSITVTGALYTYDPSTGEVSLYNASGNVTITASCAIEYSVSVSISNGSYTAPSVIRAGETITVTISPFGGYTYPAAVGVVNADSTYNDATGEVSIFNPTGNVGVGIVCPALRSISGTAVNAQINGQTSYLGSLAADRSSTLSLSADGTTYKLPSAITINGSSCASGATVDNCTYTRTSNIAGTVVITQPAQNITFSVTGEYVLPQLAAPDIELEVT